MRQKGDGPVIMFANTDERSFCHDSRQNEQD